MQEKIDWLAKTQDQINNSLLEGTDFEVEFVFKDNKLITSVFAGEDKELLATGYQDDQEMLDRIFNLDDFMAPLKMLEVATELAVKYCTYRKEISEKFNASVVKSRKKLFAMFRSAADDKTTMDNFTEMVEELIEHEFGDKH